MPNTSHDLAKQIADGSLSFSNLEGCDAKLTTNANPLVIKYNQLFLVRQGKEVDSPYLSYSPFLDVSGFNERQRTSIANSMASNILGGLPTQQHIKRHSIPDPDKRDRTLEKTNILVENHVISPTPSANVTRIQAEYKQFITQRIEAETKETHNLYAQALNISQQDFKDAVQLAKAIAARLLDPFHSSSPSRYKCAVFGLYEQVWKPAGYTRGDLIKSLCLCPGETVTLEYHHWDKTIIKSEQELSNELELKSSSTLTQRDSKELLDELTKNNQLKLDANAQVTIPVAPVNVTGGDAASLTEQVQPHVSNAVKSSIENVVSASNDFKQTRKIRIEETRDSGREEKQTRVVANTNRCRTLEFRYFEVLSNYLVTSSCAGFQVCLLLPFTVEFNGRAFQCKSIDAKFILCNEHILKGVLVDPKFAAGFDAAKRVESFDKLKELYAENVASAVPANPSSSGGSQQGIENEFEQLRSSILNAYDTLNSSARDVAHAFADVHNLADLLVHIGEIVDSIVSAIRKLPALAALDLDSDTHHAIEALKSSRKPARQALRDFFAEVSENDFQFLNPVTGDVADALEQLGVPFSDQIAGYVFDLGIVGAIGNAVKDDAGLRDAVQAAESFFDSTDRTPTGRVTTPPAGTDSPAPSQTNQPSSIADLVSITEIADAYVELDRLICHIRSNCDYYKQALWLSKGPDYRAEFLVKARVSQFVSNQVIGFYENYAAFPIIDSSFLKKVLNVPQLLKLLSGTVPEDISELITIPTSSTVMTGQLGECDLCEEYIEKSREADVRQQNAKAALDEADAGYKNARTDVTAQEALRIAARLASRPPDLSDPIEHSNAQLDVAVTTQDIKP
jgi:hypothetical protein